MDRLPENRTIAVVGMAEDTETRPASAEEEREEGEIADDDNNSSSAAAPRGGVHPLEHAWTFWFDNPQGKSRQQAWGSTIHPIHTFSTVEDFWRYNPFRLLLLYPAGP